ncbi:hypothetical protein [Alkalihalobacterium alkalinitrilicum]|nr:hypothetical protein [Alkalihalobacterium alkalinitrilicum]
MKKQGKQLRKDKRQEPLQNIGDTSNKANKQPVPQPKDYEDIEY